MAMRLTITAKDVKAEKIVKPDWYPTKITKVAKETAKDKQSENYVVDIEGMDGDALGVPAKVFFSEKFIQNINPLIRATGPLQGIEQPLDEEKGLDPRFDLEKIVDNVVAAKWVTNRGKDGNDKARNAVDDWAPMVAVFPDHSLTVKPASVGSVGAGGFEG